ncbi:chemotaxis protein CheD [Salipiger marinus]|jgi:chemotaxis protein CheD|uniref:Probable chemoreceptor glutamine deamidase CheD n=1 Tax=Salipiger marinus TaxID=555512 RepID=A0A1G8MNN4_9RHOB|nr:MULTISPECIES: chemotaxis protein CheD [Salipiger]HBM61029.1 chemotaxis protein CheD [Citreicella sp.]MCD1617507.1 chemotaxis protein CheD [Salipiger manganoxidans]MEB3419685.1 chemotaxis protein CheD [Salipiger manganoxidans]SDI69628.1 chemotaxis protein CheD [Salipiger marinus]HBT02391.1 chemotaxis protein CheD [Citreicella sp.]
MIESGEKLVNVIQGEYKISRNPGEVLSTVLGSCAAVCLCDPEARVGGMNHFLLPQRSGKEGENVRYGAYSMELLINGMLKHGARKNRLIAKLFGGANMISQLRDIGSDNVAFAKEFLQNESIPLASASTGGSSARRIRFWPTDGRVRQFIVPGELERVAPIAPPKPAETEIILF